jgi:hypothetical protein
LHAVVSAPVVGATSLDKLKELIGRPRLPFQLPQHLTASSADAVDIKLSEEEIKYLEEPYTPMAVIGHF